MWPSVIQIQNVILWFWSFILDFLMTENINLNVERDGACHLSKVTGWDVAMTFSVLDKKSAMWNTDV